MSVSNYAPNHDAALAEIGDAKNYNDWLFGRARPFLGRRVVDAGAGIGTFTALAAREVDSVVALEPHPPFAEHLRNEFSRTANVRVVEADAAAARSEQLGEPADSVVCFNVLEHIPDDEEALRSLRALLRPGGHLLLLVPAHPQLYGGADRAYGHVRRYRARPLAALLERIGFDVVTCRYVNPVGAAGWLVSMRLLGKREVAPGSVKAFDRLVPVLRHLDRVTMPFGQSLWAVGRRRDEPGDEVQPPVEHERRRERVET
jgi:SAM-dependent methyltransferase